MLFRAYEPTDAEACLALFDSNVPAYFAVSERQGFADFLAALPTSEVRYLVVVDRDRIVACGGVGLREGEARMCWGIVDGGRHGARIGSELLLVRLLRGAELGATRAGLDTIPKTVPFFARFGFAVVREVEDGYGPGIHRRDLSMDLDGATVARLENQLADLRRVD